MKRKSSQLMDTCDTSETCGTNEPSESGKTTNESLTDVDSKKANRSESFERECCPKIERQRQRHLSKRSAAVRQHDTTKPPPVSVVHVRNDIRRPQSCSQELAFWRSHHPAWMVASHGWVSVKTLSTSVFFSGKRLWAFHRTIITKHRHDNHWAQQLFLRDDEVSQFIFLSVHEFFFFALDSCQTGNFLKKKVPCSWFHHCHLRFQKFLGKWSKVWKIIENVSTVCNMLSCFVCRFRWHWIIHDLIFGVVLFFSLRHGFRKRFQLYSSILMTLSNSWLSEVM